MSQSLVELTTSVVQLAAAGLIAGQQSTIAARRGNGAGDQPGAVVVTAELARPRGGTGTACQCRPGGLAIVTPHPPRRPEGHQTA